MEFSNPTPYIPLTLLTTTSSIKTPAATNQYHALSNNSVALTVGTWEVNANALFDSSGGNPVYTLAALGIYGSNGADNSSVPTLLSATSNLTVNSALVSSTGFYSFIKGVLSDGEIVVSPSIIVTVTATVTIYAVTFASLTTASVSRISVGLTAQRIY